MPTSVSQKREADRTNDLNEYNILGTPPEQRFDDLTLLASEICQAPLCLISLVDKDRLWFKSVVGIKFHETPRKSSFCSHAILQRHPFVVKDATQDQRFCDNPLVYGDLKICFYVGVPLLNSEGHALGTLCIMDRQTRTLAPFQMKSLETLARQVEQLLDFHRHSLLQAKLSKEEHWVAWLATSPMR